MIIRTRRFVKHPLSTKEPLNKPDPNNTKRISVIGGSRVSDSIRGVALQVGAEIARRGAVLYCGGLGGVMKAACRGAKEEGGTTVGILPTENAEDANEYVDYPIVTGMGEARNLIVALSGDGVIAVNGGFGTLSEMAFAKKGKRPVAAVQSMDLRDLFEEDLPSFSTFETAPEAVDWLFDQTTPSSP